MKDKLSPWLVCTTHSTLATKVVAVILIAAMLAAGLSALLPAQTAAAQSGSAFKTVECSAFPLPSGASPRDESWVCGYLTVPAEHARPDGPTIQLAVVILKATGQSPQPDPLFMAQGGPGGSTIYTYTSLLPSALRQARDIVLFDQRGTLYSKPALYCKEIDELTLRTLDQNLTPEENARLNLQATTACRQRLAQEGINLSAFDSIENAADIETLRQALGYSKINLYGVSYGTLLALHYMRLFPNSLRSVILDGVVPPQTNFILTATKNEDQSFTRLFSACQADPACNKEYPNLEQVFFDLVDQLNQTPARVTLTDMDSGQSHPNTVLNGDTFLWLVYQMQYASSAIPALPRIIYDAKQGNFDVASRLLSLVVFDHSMSYGMYFSVVCAEDADFSAQDQDLSGVRPEVARVEARGPQEILDTCQAWNVEPLAPQVAEPVQSDIPTLLLSGAFDPITPAPNAEAAAATLSHSYAFVFPAGGHGQLMENKCVDGIVDAFLADPSRKPDGACIQQETGPAFYTNRTVIKVPGLGKILNLDLTATLPYLVLILGALFLLTAFLVFPIAWLVNRARRSSSRPATAAPYPPSAIDSGDGLPADWQSPAAPTWQPEAPASPAAPSTWRRISSWVALLQGVLLVAFLTAVMVFLAQMMNGNDFRIFYGFPGEARPWFILPLLFALLSLVMLVIMVMLWVRREGSVWRRLYYTLLAITALVCTAALASAGLLTGFF